MSDPEKTLTPNETVRVQAGSDPKTEVGKKRDDGGTGDDGPVHRAGGAPGTGTPSANI